MILKLLCFAAYLRCHEYLKAPKTIDFKYFLACDTLTSFIFMEFQLITIPQSFFVHNTILMPEFSRANLKIEFLSEVIISNVPSESSKRLQLKIILKLPRNLEYFSKRSKQSLHQDVNFPRLINFSSLKWFWIMQLHACAFMIRMNIHVPWCEE